MNFEFYDLTGTTFQAKIFLQSVEKKLNSKVIIYRCYRFKKDAPKGQGAEYLKTVSSEVLLFGSIASNKAPESL